MILATVIMNAVYLVSETRVKVGEPGINDPGVKVVVTMVTYGLLFALQVAAYHPLGSHTPTHAVADYHPWPALRAAVAGCDGPVDRHARHQRHRRRRPEGHAPAAWWGLRDAGALAAHLSTSLPLSLSIYLPLYLSIYLPLSTSPPLHRSPPPGALGARRHGLHSHLHRLPRLRHLRHR